MITTSPPKIGDGRGTAALILARRTAGQDKPVCKGIRGSVQCRTDHNVSAEVQDPEVWQFVTDWFTQVVNGPRRREKAAAEQENRREL